MNKGEIYLVNFDPSTGNEFKKVRPAIVLQSEKISSSLLTIMPISSQLQKRGLSDIEINKTKENRLFLDSVIKVKQISSFDKNRFIHFIGHVNEKIIKEIDNYLMRHFGLRTPPVR